MPPKSNQLTLDFEKLTEKTLQPVLKKFQKAGYTVVKVDAPNKAKRESGFLIKNFTLTFEDEQQILVRVKAGGTIFQVKLNNRVVPIKHVDDMEKAISEIANYLYDNAKAFARAKAQRERRKLKPPAPSITTTRKEKIEKAKADLEAISQNNADLEKQLAESNSTITDSQTKLEAAERSLAQEKAKTASLEAQIAQLQKAQGA